MTRAKRQGYSLERSTISCSRAAPLSAWALVGCALRTRRLVHGMHPTDGNGGLYGSVKHSGVKRPSLSTDQQHYPPDNENRPGYVGLGDAFTIVQHQMAQDERDERYD